ncbi:MAG: metallophosphoesterase [Rhodospirillum sp.]|nr:metallophosphoesterase [Rhodospirillum sp.]MCF8489827.1 metallophosphoesterase [Rhodospirillum sp.]MCF8499678.1 metallophosphoesterase [Rhodospirillum sp.]
MRLWAISDLHVGHPDNRTLIQAIPDHGPDWLILGGDLGESLDHLVFVLDTLGPRFAKLLWIPGNHDLWSRPGDPRGEDKYHQLVEACRVRGVTTPEDPYLLWPGPLPPGLGAEAPIHLAPLFLLYDYGFRPAEVSLDGVLDWAMEENILCADERLLDPHPHPSRVAWCHTRLKLTEDRLSALPREVRTVLINHWPLRRDLLFIRRVPRFSPWCGTPLTEDWHRRFRAVVVVTGHQHVPRTDWRDGTRFEEVSLGYPREWRRWLGEAPVRPSLREILPGPAI